MLVGCGSDAGPQPEPRTPVGRATTWRQHCTEVCANPPKVECAAGLLFGNGNKHPVTYGAQTTDDGDL